MNKIHLELCGGDEWAETVKRFIIPWALADHDIGNHVLEVGPGPGRTTDILTSMADRLTCVEIDADLAASLAARMVGSNVTVVHADATRLPFPARRFSTAASFTMLHHVPTAELQDQLFAEVARVLRPGAVFAGVDSRDSADFRALHEDDVCVPIDPDGLRARFLAAGFADADIESNEYATRFRAHAPGA